MATPNRWKMKLCDPEVESGVRGQLTHANYISEKWNFLVKYCIPVVVEWVTFCLDPLIVQFDADSV